MSNPIKDIEYSDKINCKFSEAIYQKMITKRFGIKNCCEIDGERYIIDKELLDLNDVMNMPVTRTVCPTPSEDDCVISCLNFNGICLTTYQNLYVLLSKGQVRFTFYDLINQYATLWPNIFIDVHQEIPSLFEDGCASNYPFELAAAFNWIDQRISTTPAEDAAATTLYNLIFDEFTAFGLLADAYYQEYTLWQNSSYSSSLTPTALMDIKINYTTCSGTVMTISFMKFLTIYRNGTIDITFTDAVLTASTYGSLLDLNTYITSQFTITNTVCCDCLLPGQTDYNGQYLRLALCRNDYLDDPTLEPTTEELENLRLPYAIQPNWDIAEDAFFAYTADQMQANQFKTPGVLDPVLPPSAEASWYKGPQNAGFINYRIFAGNKCDGYTLTYLPYVEIVADLPTTGNKYEAIYVVETGDHYAWDESTQTWSNALYRQYDIACGAQQRAQRDAFIRALQEFILSMRPFVWSHYYIPKFQITKYKL